MSKSMQPPLEQAKQRIKDLENTLEDIVEFFGDQELTSRERAVVNTIKAVLYN